jgi:hypothetical protein
MSLLHPQGFLEILQCVFYAPGVLVGDLMLGRKSGEFL